MFPHIDKEYTHDEHEARGALWNAICDAASRLAGKCSFYSSGNTSRTHSILYGKRTPDVQTWQLMEALSLICVLMKADDIRAPHVYNIFGKTGPIHFIDEGKNRYLWAQFTLIGEESSLIGRPDLIISSSSELPNSKTALQVIECKCRKKIGAPDIRAEFGKAHDLGVTSYLIWSFYTPSPSIVLGANRLGIDIVPLGFDSSRRKDLIDMPESLVFHVANTQKASKTEKRFAQKAISIGHEIENKLIPPV